MPTTGKPERKPGRPKKKHPGGRPTVMTDQVIQKLVDAFSWGATDLEACAVADISQTKLYQYQSDNPKFKEQKDRLKSMTALHARRNISKDVKSGSVHTAKWYAERRIEEFNPKKQIQIEHDHKLSIDSDLLAEYQRLTKQIPDDIEEAEVINELIE